MRKRIAALLICLPLVLGAAACKKEGGRTSAPGEIEFWTTYATEKVLRDRAPNEDIKLGESLEAAACRGEYESAQVVMTAKTDVKAYDAEIGDLTGPDGAVFSKNDVILRHQKYIQVNTIFSDYNSPPTGWYPDALVPLDTIVAYKENTIAAGDNQGLYVTFRVPADQPAGAYTGSLKITYDGREKLLPVRLTVYDLTVSAETRSKSYFNLGFSQQMGELDGTENMWRAYCEALLDYRISPSVALRTPMSSDAGMDAYVDAVFDLVKNEGMSTINSPWKTGADLTGFLIKLAEKSVKEKINLLEKTIVKGPDEPKVDALDSVADFMESFHKGVNDAVKAFPELKKLGADDGFIAALQSSAEKIPCIIALLYSRSEATDKANVDTYCPLYDKYDTPESRALYDDQSKGRWWYGCIEPRPPYPTYHTEDTLVSARSVGWMMSEYDVVGNLYWAATVYARYDGTAYQPIEDYYEGAADRFRNCNGDGYLFYPGAPYGIDGPVASLRLEAIRDGNEDYELLYDLRAAYERAGLDPAAIQRNVSALIYTGTKVRYAGISERFAAARKAMIQLSLLAQSPAEVFITDVRDDNKGTVTYTVSAKKGSVLKNAGEVLTGADAGERTLYTIVVKLDKASNALALSAEADGKVYEFGFDLGGKAVYYGADRLLDADNRFTPGTAAVEATFSEEKVKLEIGAVAGKHQSVRYASAVLGTIDAASKRLVLYAENPGETDMTFRLLVRFENNDLNTELFSGTLKPGANELEIDLSSVNLSGSGKIEYADLYFSQASGEHAAKTLYLNGLTVYGA